MPEQTFANISSLNEAWTGGITFRREQEQEVSRSLKAAETRADLRRKTTAIYKKQQQQTTG
jgi:hypothetical protein